MAIVVGFDRYFLFLAGHMSLADPGVRGRIGGYKAHNKLAVHKVQTGFR